jgi:UDP-2-acetamido-3-amino-2,3-dideoxy-glucuronate N-acetyltransferase
MTEKFIALIGSGYWGKNLLRDLSTIGVLKTVCEVNKNVHTQIKEKYPDVEITENWKNVI